MTDRGREGGDPACYAHLLDGDDAFVTDGSTGVGSELTLRPRGPFRLDLTVAVARRHSSNEVDRWDDDTQSYRRVLHTTAGPLELTVTQHGSVEEPQLHVRIDGEPERPFAARAEIGRALDEMLGLGIDLTGFHQLAARDPFLAPLADRFRGVRPTRFPDWTEALTAAVSCQQLRVAGGIGLLNRLTERFGRSGPRGARAFPDAATLASAGHDALCELGYSAQRARTVCTLAAALADGSLDPETWTSEPDDVVAARLCEWPGVGPWTAAYVMLRRMGRLHVLPADDSGALGTARAIWADEHLDEAAWRERARGWRPYGGLVYFHLLLAAGRPV